MPHPLPIDVNAVPGLRYYLVAIPDDEAFSRAALAIYSELENYYMWGSEGPVENDSDKAATVWAAAVAETVRLIQMGWPDEVLGYIDDIEGMLRGLQNLSGCCGDSDPSDGDFYTDPVSDGVGNVPQNIINAGYATTVADWAGFDDYKCMIAHIAVSDMEAKLRKLAPLVDDAGSIFGGIGAIVAIIAAIFASGGTLMFLGILGATGAAAALFSKLAVAGPLEALADDVATNHDELACAIYQDSDGPADALVKLHAKIDELFNPIVAVILKSLNNGPVIKALYAGRYDQQDIAATLSANGYLTSGYVCNCEEPTLFEYTWDAGMQAWPTGGNATQTYLTPNIGLVSDTSSGSLRSTAGNPTGNAIKDLFVLGSVPVISNGRARFKFRTGTQSPRQTVQFIFIDDVGTQHFSPEYDSDVIGYNVWSDVTWAIGSTITLRASLTAINIGVKRFGAVSGTLPYIEIDYFGATA